MHSRGLTPVLLIILDGWGYSENTEFNAIHSAHTPAWDALWEQNPHTLLCASGDEVGLPGNQMGNSEVGHMHIGAGRLIDQDFTRITRSIENGSFFRTPALLQAFRQATESGKAVHVLGLLSPGGVHAHEDHILATIQLAVDCGVDRLYLHAFLDGRDTPPRSAAESIRRTQIELDRIGKGQFASVIGRYYAMDRNRNWNRTRKAYDLIALGKARRRAKNPLIALDQAYQKGESDEFVKAAITTRQNPPVRILDGDVVIFTNYRADRARQLFNALTKRDFVSFERSQLPSLGACVTLTEYSPEYNFPVAFPPERLKNVLGEYISRLGLKQLRIAETEKYAHVTFFFNGGEERPFEGEDRILVPSPHISTYDKRPEMSAGKITRKLIRAIRRLDYDAIICNFANADMVGHSGDLQATIRAIETIDECLGKIRQECRAHGYDLIITADHGNAEQMKSYITEKVQAESHTAHTSNPVPFVHVGRACTIEHASGVLSDIAPTMLHLLGLEKPPEMTGRSLLRLKGGGSEREPGDNS